MNVWEAYAIRYAHHHRLTRENFLGPNLTPNSAGQDPHEDSPMPMDYFIWAVRSGQTVYVIDTGFDEAMAAKRGRTPLNRPDAGLREIGIDAAQVENVILSHLHYDHCGNHKMFPRARYHVQDREMFFATGRHMCHAHMRIPFEEEDVVEMVRRLYSGRVVFYDGDEEIAPGLTLHRVGGHSMGLQMIRVHTRRGWVLLAADATHYYANLEQGRPYPITYNVGEAVEAFRRIYELADSPDHVIPGHDPLVLERYPAPRPELAGWIVRLD